MNILRPLVAGLPVLVIAATATMSAAHAKPVCKPAVTGHGIHAAKVVARTKARKHWRKRVKILHGASFAKIGKANPKKMKCKKSGKWHCKFIARPCKSGFAGPGDIAN